MCLHLSQLLTELTLMIDELQCATYGYAWFCKPMYGKVISDDLIDSCFSYEYERDLVYEAPNGQTCLYRLICKGDINSNIEPR